MSREMKYKVAAVAFIVVTMVIPLVLIPHFIVDAPAWYRSMMGVMKVGMASFIWQIPSTNKQSARGRRD